MRKERSVLGCLMAEGVLQRTEAIEMSFRCWCPAKPSQNNDGIIQLDMNKQHRKKGEEGLGGYNGSIYTQQFKIKGR